MASEEDFLPTPASYATPKQLDANREYAKALLGASMAQPQHANWATGLDQMVKAIYGNYKLGQTGQQDVSQYMKGFQDVPKDPNDPGKAVDWSGMNNQGSGVPYTSAPFGAGGLAEAVKGFEGFEPISKADTKQFSYGYGSKAPGPGLSIDKDTANKKLQRDLDRAAAVVDKINPNLSPGTKAALTSLTYNTGEKWTQSGLGKAVAAGDEEAAKKIFTQYVNVGGSPSPGVANRRQAEASWFGGQGPTMAFAGKPEDEMTGDGLTDITRALAPAINRMQPPSQAPGVATRVAGPDPSNDQANPIGPIPHKIPITYQQMMRTLTNPSATPEIKKFIMESYYGQYQPFEVKGYGGNYTIDPTGKVQPRWVPDYHETELAAGPAKMKAPFSLNSKGQMELHTPGGNTGGAAPGSVPFTGDAKGPLGTEAPKSNSGPLGGFMDRLMDYGINQEGRMETEKERAKKEADNYEKKYESTVATGASARTNQPLLEEAQRAVEDPRFYQGPFGHEVLQAQKLMDSLGFTDNKAGPGQVFQKLLSGQILRDMKSNLEGLGQVRVAEINLLNQANASNNNTREANRAILDLTKRLYERSIGLSQLATEYRQQTGKNIDNNEYNRREQKWMDAHPLFTPEEEKNWTNTFKQRPELAPPKSSRPLRNPRAVPEYGSELPQGFQLK